MGGGQLGRMLALAAARLGFKCHIYAPAGDNPAFDVAAVHTCAAYDDAAALAAFARSCDVVTYEFENVPVISAEAVARHTRLAPGANVLRVTQDRLSEKTFLKDAGIDVAPFAAVSSMDELQSALAGIGRPAILKTRRLGYDGKGQAVISPDSDAGEAWAAMAGAPAILEGFVAFRCEVSVIAARGLDGGFATFDLPENRHEKQILRTSHVPAGINPASAEQARQMACKVAEAFGYVGVFAVELFVAGEGSGERLIANEIAPRVHNSGHWTEAACAVSQFEQHIRAIAGWPLGDPARHSNAVMHNLLGDEIDDCAALAAEAGAVVHDYGKAEARAGRKMGHVTRLSPLENDA